MSIAKFSGIGKEGATSDLLKNPGKYGFKVVEFSAPFTFHYSQEIFKVTDHFSPAQRQKFVDDSVTFNLMFSVSTSSLSGTSKGIGYRFNGGAVNYQPVQGADCSFIEKSFKIRVSAHLYRSVQITGYGWNGICGPGWNPMHGIMIYNPNP